MRKIKALILTLPALALLSGEVTVGFGVVAASSLLSTSVYAADKKKTVSAKVGKPLQEAQKLAQAKNFKGALDQVKEAQAIPGKTPYEENTINEFLAYIYLNLRDYSSAAKAYEATLDSGELTAQQKQQRLEQIVKMYYQAKNYSKSIQVGDRYLKEVGPNVDIALLITQAYYIQNDYAHAADAAKNLIEVARKTGQPVKEDWLKLLMSSQYKLNRDADRAATLEQLLVQFPKPAYWQDMLNYLESKSGVSDRMSLEIFRLKMATGILKSNEYVEMAQLAMALGFPGDALNVVQQGFSSKVLGTGADQKRESRLLDLAEKQSASDQKSLPQLDKEARAAADGNADIKLGEAYVSYNQLDKAMEAFKRGFSKGGIKDVGEARLYYGLAYFDAKQYDNAIAQFKAVPADSKLADVAKLWRIHTQNTKK
jgi:hypothetical protein